MSAAPRPGHRLACTRRGAALFGDHPPARAFIEPLMQKPVPTSYGKASYHAEHAFRFTAADGTSRFGRYHRVPEAGEAYLPPDDASMRSANFLSEELESRLRRGAVVVRPVLQLAAEGDPTDDVTALRPEDRPLVELGRLEVTDISPIMVGWSCCAVTFT
jgi:catalase